MSATYSIEKSRENEKFFWKYQVDGEGESEKIKTYIFYRCMSLCINSEISTAECIG